MTPAAAGGGSGSSAAEHLARAGWPAVQTALLQGIAHALSGRAAALAGLTELLRRGDGEGDGASLPLLDLLGEESERLAEVVDLLRLLGEDDEAPEPLAPARLVEEVLRVHRRHRGLETVETVLEVEGDVPPVRVGRTSLVRVLLLLLAAVGWEASRAGASRIEVRLRRRDDRVVVALGIPADDAPAPPEAEDAGRRPAPEPEAAMEAAEAVLAGDGAAIRRIGDRGPGAGVELSFPVLERRERD